VRWLTLVLEFIGRIFGLIRLQSAEQKIKDDQEKLQREQAALKIEKDITDAVQSIKPVELDESETSKDPLGIRRWNTHRD